MKGGKPLLAYVQGNKGYVDAKDEVKLVVDLNEQVDNINKYRYKTSVYSWGTCIWSQWYEIEIGTQTLTLGQKSWKIGHYGLILELYKGKKCKERCVLSFSIQKNGYHHHNVALIGKEERVSVDNLKYLGLYENTLTTLSYLPLQQLWEDYYDSRSHWDIIDNTRKQHRNIKHVMDYKDNAYTCFASFLHRKMVDHQESHKGVLLHIEGMDYERLKEYTNIKEDKNKHNRHLIILRNYYWPLKNYDLEEQDALALRVDRPYATYYQLRNIINEGKYFSHYSPLLLDLSLPPLTSTALLHRYKLLLASLFTHGSYFVARHVQSSFFSQLSPYFHFSRWFNDILFEDNITDVTKIFLRMRENTKCFQGFRHSIAALDNKVWLCIKDHPKFFMISLINLCGNNGNWLEDKKQPEYLKDLHFHLPVDFSVQQVLVATPDKDDMISSIDYQEALIEVKHIIDFTIEDLHYWSVVLLMKREK